MLKNNFKQFGYVFAHLAPGVALTALAVLATGGLGAGALPMFLTGMGTLAASELVGGTMLHFNENFHGLVDANSEARKRIAESRKKIAGIRKDVLSGNLNAVGALGDLQEELWANMGFIDRNGHVLREVKNDTRIKGAFNRTGGVSADFRKLITNFASA